MSTGAAKLVQPRASVDRPVRGGTALCRAGGLDWVAFTELADARAPWLQLQKSARATPFQQLSWIEACVGAGALEAGTLPVVVVGYDGQEPRALLALAIRRDWLCRRLVWLADAFNDYNAPLIDPDFADVLSPQIAAQIFRRISHEVAPLDAVHLVRQPDGPDPAVRPITRNNTADAEHSAHAIELQRDWRALYRQLRSSKSRQRLRNKYKSLKAKGAISFARVRDQRQRVRIANRILDWKSQQLEGRGARNPFAGEPSGRLRNAICDLLEDDAGGLVVYALFVDGVPVAGIIAFVDRSTFSLFVCAYDPDNCARCSTGILLMMKTLELAARAGLTRYDFMFGDEPYKLEWANRRIALRHHASAYTPQGLAYCLAVVTGLAAKKWLLARPAAMGFVEAANRTRRKLLNWEISDGRLADI